MSCRDDLAQPKPQPHAYAAMCMMCAAVSTKDHTAPPAAMGQGRDTGTAQHSSSGVQDLELLASARCRHYYTPMMSIVSSEQPTPVSGIVDVGVFVLAMVLLLVGRTVVDEKHVR